jgi:hypothetical protein
MKRAFEPVKIPVDNRHERGKQPLPPINSVQPPDIIRELRSMQPAQIQGFLTSTVSGMVAHYMSQMVKFR